MTKRTLIAIAAVALLATSAQALGPDPHSNGDSKNPGIKVNNEKITIGWPFEYKALDLCSIPVYLNVGYFVQVEKCHERKIKLQQVDCADIGKDKWPCYKDCEDVKVRANFEVKLGLRKEKTSDVIKGNNWSAYFQGSDVVPGDGGWHTVTACVETWEAQLLKAAPGAEIRVGTVYLTVKPNV